MLTKSRVVQLLLMLSILLLLFFWRTFDVTQDEFVKENNDSDAHSDLLRCDYVSACEFKTAQGIFYLKIKELPIRAEEWINFELRTPLESMKVSKAQIVGKSMFMGRIPVMFKREKNRLFLGKSLVGACTTDEMIWTLEITVSNSDEFETIMFDFMVKR